MNFAIFRNKYYMCNSKKFYKKGLIDCTDFMYDSATTEPVVAFDFMRPRSRPRPSSDVHRLEHKSCQLGDDLRVFSVTWQARPWRPLLARSLKCSSELMWQP